MKSFDFSESKNESRTNDDGVAVFVVVGSDCE